MKKKLQRNNWRRAKRLTKVQTTSVPDARSFWKSYRAYRKSRISNPVKLKRLRNLAGDKSVSTFWPKMQGHYQRAWNCYNRMKRSDRT